MVKPTNAFVAKPSTGTAVFAGAEQAADYDEDIDTKFHGTRPRRSEQPESNRATQVPPVFESPHTADGDAVANTPTSPATLGATPLDSALFAGALTTRQQLDSTRAPARTGVRGWFNRFGLHLAPGVDELAQLEWERQLQAAQALIRQATWTRAVSVLVANPKGGTGKTPLSLLLGGTLASIRGGWFNRFGLHLAPGVDELAQLERERQLQAAQALIRQATWTRAVSVLVANPKGGTGKTPLSLLLGGTLASIRGGSVAVIEVADDPGALAYRAEGTPRLGIGDLVRDAAQIRTAGQLAGYTAPQTSFAAVIGSPNRRPRLDAEDVAAMVRVIDEYYSIRVMDSGNQPSSSAFQGALAATDVLVVPVVNAGDSTLEAVRMLDGMRETGGHAADLAARAIVVRITDGRPESEAINAEVARVMGAAGAAAICDLPYDPHIAERGQVTLGNLNADTRAALTHMAATVVGAFNEHATQIELEVTR